MEQSCFIGIDLGSSAIKLLLLNGQQQVIAHKSVGYDTCQPASGWHEIDPEIWFTCMEKGLTDLLRDVDPQRVDAIGVTGQMHTLVILDKSGKSVRPAIMWDDTRTKELLPSMRGKLTEKRECESVLRTLSTGSPAANLYWLKECEAENYARISKFLIASDYLVYRLCGQYGTDYCGASTSSLYDINQRRWSATMRELLELPESVYPEIHGSAISAGNILGEIAEKFGFRPNVTVITGTGDNPATAISSGCLGYGDLAISLGTSGVLMYHTNEYMADAKGKFILFSPDEKIFSYIVQGVVQSTGSSLEWWVHDILGIEGFDDLDSIMRNAKASDLLFFPHLTGDKTLYADPTIRGAFIGLSTQTTREDMIFAVIEGLCYGFKELVEKMQIRLDSYENLKLVGGGAKSRVWAQLMADVLNIPVAQMRGKASPALGIALLAAYNIGCIGDFRKIGNMGITAKELFYPQPKMAEAHNRAYERYLRVYGALKTVDN